MGRRKEEEEGGYCSNANEAHQQTRQQSRRPQPDISWRVLSSGGRAPETTNREGGYREKKNRDKHAKKKEKSRNCPRKGGERRNVSGGVWEHRSPRPPFAGRNPFRKQRTTTTRNGGRTFIHSAHSSVAGFCARRNLFCGRRESQAQIALLGLCRSRPYGRPFLHGSEVSSDLPTFRFVEVATARWRLWRLVRVVVSGIGRISRIGQHFSNFIVFFIVFF